MASSSEQRTVKLEEQSSFPHVQEIADYSVVRLLGIGGMGEVFLAEQKSLKRMVALKVLLPALVNNRKCLDRFFREVRTLAKVEHPNIVQAIEAGAENDICFFSMQYVDGKDLRQLIDSSGGMAEYESLKIVRTIASTLDYAWRKLQLLHRDIKPSNIMLAKTGEIKLLDFGISKIVSDTQEVEITRQGMMVGSPHYISPEQAKAEKADFHSDMYSLGATLYHMLSGEPPYDADTSMGIVSKHFSEPVPDIRKTAPIISQGTAILIKSLMAKKPEDRFDSWQDVIDAIEKILNKINPEEDAAPRKRFPVKRIRRLLRLLAALSMMIAAMAMLVRYSIDEAQRKKRNAAYLRTIKFASNCKSENYQIAIKRLENVIRSAPAPYVVAAKKALNKINENIAAEKRREEEQRINMTLKNLRMRSYQLEKTGQYAKAVKLWEYHRTNSPFRNNRRFTIEVHRTINYLKEQQKKKILKSESKF
jgi:serine/threonine protein kinase